jgi:hypothetical protein
VMAQVMKTSGFMSGLLSGAAPLAFRGSHRPGPSVELDNGREDSASGTRHLR